ATTRCNIVLVGSPSVSSLTSMVAIDDGSLGCARSAAWQSHCPVIALLPPAPSHRPSYSNWPLAASIHSPVSATCGLSYVEQPALAGCTTFLVLHFGQWPSHGASLFFAIEHNLA